MKTSNATPASMPTRQKVSATLNGDDPLTEYLVRRGVRRYLAAAIVEIVREASDARRW
jgi:hypothetical protein